MVRAAALSTCLLLSACGNPALTQAHNVIAALVKDPASLQYRNEKVSPAAVCGEYNAKNEMGGYVGFKKYAFAADLGKAFLEGADEGDDIWRRSIIEISGCIEGLPKAQLAAKLQRYDTLLKRAYDNWTKACERGGYGMENKACSEAGDIGRQTYEQVTGNKLDT